jgi:hypothetical protein
MLEIALAGINSFAFAPKADIITAHPNRLQEIKNKVAQLIDLRDKGRQDEKIASHGLPLPDTNRHTKEPAITA